MQLCVCNLSSGSSFVHASLFDGIFRYETSILSIRQKNSLALRNLKPGTPLILTITNITRIVHAIQQK